jgi:hypothetical protein
MGSTHLVGMVVSIDARAEAISEMLCFIWTSVCCGLADAGVFVTLWPVNFWNFNTIISVFVIIYFTQCLNFSSNYFH